MENQRNLLFIGLLTISVVLYMKWLEFSKQAHEQATTPPTSVLDNGGAPSLPAVNVANNGNEIPVAPVSATNVPTVASPIGDGGTLIRVETDLVIATINTLGGTIERLELKQEPQSPETPDQGFILLKNDADEQFAVEDGLQTTANNAPTHRSLYQYQQTSYQLGDAASVTVPLSYVSSDGVQFTKNITFVRDSYVIEIDYQISNTGAATWTGFFYGQFRRTEPANSGGGFGQLPSYTGGAFYTEEDKYTKYDFGDMRDDSLAVNVDKAWVAMLQHYFVGVFLPADTQKRLYSLAGNEANPIYRIGYLDTNPITIAANSQGTASGKLYVGPKTHDRLIRLESGEGFNGLSRTIDYSRYGWLNFISEWLFKFLNLIYGVVGNWGWAIVLLTVAIKAAFYPLSDKAGKSSAAMKKVQPRLQTLKERYKDDRQKFQMEMMALYKEEKINPAGGCLPILVQMPVFLALYWVLLESVELRQAPFALWLQDLSAPDPFFILPILMGVTQFIMFRLNPMPMDDIQKKVFMIMPIVFIFIFATFPQGLVLYWVVNNILSMAQQWYINRKYTV